MLKRWIVQHENRCWVVMASTAQEALDKIVKRFDVNIQNTSVYGVFPKPAIPRVSDTGGDAC